jgi:glyoxylase-like metal-dependent hydrolase (beta-lactamase superfamily II)
MATTSFEVGRSRCEIVPDGIAPYRKETIFSDANDQELTRALEGILNAEGWLPVPYNPLLVRSGKDVVLLDTGAGAELAEEWGDPVGQLQGSLERAGIDPRQVTVVVLSHAHPDHIGGLTVEAPDGRRPVFPTARHVISSEEFEFWTAGAVPEDFASMATLATKHLLPLREAGLLELVDGETEIVPGMSIVSAPGHTPGHMVVSIAAGPGSAMYLGDAVLTEVSFEYPGWTSRLEIDRPAAAKTRRRLLDRAVEERSIVAGFHLRAAGTIEAADGGYRFATDPS